MANSQHTEILDKIEEYPVLIPNQRPFIPGSTGAKILAYVLPLGVAVRLISRLFEIRLNKDLKIVKSLNADLQLIIERL